MYCGRTNKNLIEQMKKLSFYYLKTKNKKYKKMACLLSIFSKFWDHRKYGNWKNDSKGEKPKSVDVVLDVFKIILHETEALDSIKFSNNTVITIYLASNCRKLTVCS